MAHGAPTSVDDIPLYLKNIRGGTDSSPEVIQIIRDRYEAICFILVFIWPTHFYANHSETFVIHRQVWAKNARSVNKL